MKNKSKIFGIIALAAVMAFSMAACGGNAPGGPTQTSDPQTSVYTWTDSSSNSYNLSITSTGGKALVTSGTYVLIVYPAGGGEPKTSTGTASGDLNALKLTSGGSSVTLKIDGPANNITVSVTTGSLNVGGVSVAGGGGKSVEKAGTLTITNFGGTGGLTTGKYVTGMGYITEQVAVIFAVETPTTTGGKGAKVTGSSITLNVYYLIEIGKTGEPTDYTATAYTGNATINAGDLDLFHTASETMPFDDKGPDDTISFINTADITFTNGSATINFGTQMKKQD